MFQLELVSMKKTLWVLGFQTFKTEFWIPLKFQLIIEFNLNLEVDLIDR